MRRFFCLRHRIFDFEDPFCRTIRFQKTRHNKRQIERRRQGCRCRKRDRNRSDWMIDSAGGKHTRADENQDSGKIYKEIWE